MVKARHVRRLRAALTGLEDLARQMEGAGRLGKNPVSTAALAPLDAAEWSQIEAALERARSRVRETVQQLAPDASPHQAGSEGRSATLYWLSVLLQRMEDEIEGILNPDAVERQMGALDTRDRDLLVSTAAGLRDDIAVRRERIDAFRARKWP